MPTTDSSHEAKRFAADGTNGVIHEITGIVDYPSNHAYYRARCGARVPCRSADVFTGRDLPGMVCSACKTAADGAVRHPEGTDIPS